MQDLEYPAGLKACNILKSNADTFWIDDCFRNYITSILSVISDYFLSAKRLGYDFIFSNDYLLDTIPWFVSPSIDNQEVYCNSGRMLSLILVHNNSGRSLKLDLSSFSEVLVFTTFLKLTIGTDNMVIDRQSESLFSGSCNLYSFGSPKILSKLYNFLEFGITDIELDQVLIPIH